LDTSARHIAAGDAYGLEHLLRAFGGVGSLNDVGLSRDDDLLWSLHDRMWSAARELQGLDTQVPVPVF
jgi:hypothetical protein